MEQNGMTFDKDFGYFFPLFFSLLKKREEEKKNLLVKIVSKSHAFLLDPLKKRLGKSSGSESLKN